MDQLNLHVAAKLDLLVLTDVGLGTTAACFELRPVDCARSKFFRLEAIQWPALCPSQQNGATSHKNAIKGVGDGG